MSLEKVTTGGYGGGGLTRFLFYLSLDGKLYRYVMTKKCYVCISSPSFADYKIVTKHRLTPSRYPMHLSFKYHKNMWLNIAEKPNIKTNQIVAHKI